MRCFLVNVRQAVSVPCLSRVGKLVIGMTFLAVAVQAQDSLNWPKYPLADVPGTLRIPDLTADKGITLEAALQPVADLTGADSIKIKLSSQAADLRVDQDLLKDVQNPLYPSAGDYLKMLAKAYGLSFTYLKPTLTVTTKDEQGEIEFHSLDAEAWKKRAEALAQTGWQSTPLGLTPSVAASPDAKVRTITGPEELLEEISRWQNPVTRTLQDPKRLPLRYPFSSVKAKVSPVPAHLTADKVKIKDAVTPLQGLDSGHKDASGQPVPITVDYSTVGETEISFKNSPPGWLKEGMSAAVYLGLLQHPDLLFSYHNDKKNPTLQITSRSSANLTEKSFLKTSDAVHAFLLFGLRAAGWEADVQQDWTKVTDSLPTLKLTGPAPILAEADRLLGGLGEPSKRLLLKLPLQDFDGQLVTLPAAALTTGTATGEAAVTAFGSLDTGRNNAQKVVPTLSERAKVAKVRFADQPPGFITPKMPVALYLRLIQESGLEVAFQNLAGTAALSASTLEERETVKFIKPDYVKLKEKGLPALMPDLDGAGYAYLISKLRQDGWEAETQVTGTLLGDDWIQPEIHGPPALIAAIKAMQTANKTYLDDPKETDLGQAIPGGEIETWEFPLKYAQAKSFKFKEEAEPSTLEVPGVVELLTNIVGKTANNAAGVSSISEHPRKNSVIVMDYKRRKPFYDALIAQLDQEREMIEVSISVIDVSSDAGEAWGTELLISSGSGKRPDGRLGSSAGGDLVNVLNGTTPFRTDLVEGPGFSLAGLISSSRTQVLGRISVLEGQGKAHLETRPALRTLSGLEASFSDSSKFYVEVPGINLANTFEIPVTTKIKIIPRVSNDKNGEKSIQMIVMLSDSTTVDTTTTPDGVQTPIIAASNLTTHAEIPNNGSLLVGGLYRHNQIDAESNAPYLKKVPVLNLPFKKNLVSNERLQRFFLISPRTVKVGAAADKSYPGIAEADYVTQGGALPEPAKAVQADPAPEKKGFFKRLFNGKN